jgi:hypothetical protein
MTLLRYIPFHNDFLIFLLILLFSVERYFILKYSHESALGNIIGPGNLKVPASFTCSPDLLKPDVYHNNDKLNFTGKGVPWLSEYSKEHLRKIDVKRSERQIKSKKSRKYIEWRSIHLVRAIPEFTGIFDLNRIASATNLSGLSNL